VGNKTGYINY